MEYKAIQFKYKTRFLGDIVNFNVVPFNLSLDVGLALMATPSHDMYLALILHLLRISGIETRCTPPNGWCISCVSFLNNIKLALDFSGIDDTLTFTRPQVSEIFKATGLDPNKKALEFRAYKNDPKNISDHMLLSVCMEFVLGAHVVFLNWKIEAHLIEDILLDRLDMAAKALNICIVYNIENELVLRSNKSGKYNLHLFTNHRLAYEGNDLHSAISSTIDEDVESITRALSCHAHSSNDVLENIRIIDSFSSSNIKIPFTQSMNFLDENQIFFKPTQKYISRNHMPYFTTTYKIFKHRLIYQWENKIEVTLISLYIIISLLITSFVYFQLEVTASRFSEIPRLIRFNIFLAYYTFVFGIISNFHNAIEEYRRYPWIPTISIIIGETAASIFPARLSVITIFLIAEYYITGLRTDNFSHLVVFVACLILFFLCSIAIGLLLSIFLSRKRTGQAAFTFLRLIMITFTRVPNEGNITWILRWISYINPAFYTNQCLTANQYVGLDIEKYAADIAKNQANVQLSVAACLPALAGFFLLYMLIALPGLHYIHRTKIINI